MSRPVKESVLVAGGAGYVGSHVCKALAHCGYVPVVFDNLVSGHAEFVRWGQLIQGNIADSRKVKDVVTRHQIDAVIHLAGYIDVGESQRNPAKYYENNVAASLVFLNTLRECGVSRFVFSSSASVYGTPRKIPIPESHPTHPESVYGRTKVMIESVLQDLSRVGDMKSVSLRYFNAAGASDCGKIGEDHSPETHLIPRACFAALQRVSILDIYGNDFATPDGTAVRDFVHVDDLASAHVDALVMSMEGVPARTYNIGTGTGHSVLEVINCVARIAQKPVPMRVSARREGDVAALVADSSCAVAQLGWTPKHTSLESIVSSAWNWHSSRHGKCA